MNNLKEFRRTDGVKASTLARLIGLKTNASYYKKENGDVKFTVEEALVIANHFGRRVEEIFLPQDVPLKNYNDEKLKPVRR